jgi:hypothetical protein
MGEVAKKMNQYISVLFFFWVTLIIPIYFENAYFNMLEAKGHAYVAGIFFILPFAVITCIMQKSCRDFLPERKNILDWSIFLLGIIALLSSVCSGNVGASFWGTLGWQVGAFSFLSFSLFYCFTVKNLNYSQNLWLPVMAVNFVIYIFGIFHSMGIDVLSLHEHITPKQYYWYISTIGNLNWYVGYLCLLVPLFFVFFLSAQSNFTRNICFIFLIFSCINMVLCGSDGLYLGIGVCAFFAIPYITAEGKRIQRMFVFIFFYGCSLLFIKFCPLFSNKAADIQGISAKFLNPVLSSAIMAIGLIGIIYVRHYGDKISRRNHKIMIIVLESLLAVIALVFVWDTILNFSDTWGTNRGLTWRYSMEMFRDFSIKEKLLGVGPEMLRSYYTDLSTHFSRKILVAHSEPLQILLTMGILGFVCWISIWGTIIIRYFKSHIWEQNTIAFFLPLIAYWGQSFVNSPQSTNIALLCILLSCFRIHDREEQENSLP